MKFAARDGSAARTLAFTKTPAAIQSQFRTWPGLEFTNVPCSPIPVDGVGRSRSDDNGSSRRSRSGSPTTVNYLRGQEIFTPGHGEGFVYIVRTGCVRLYKVLPDGRSVNLGLLGPSTVFTQEETSDGIASGAIAEAMVDSTLSIVEMDALASIIADAPELAAAVVNGMSRRLTELQTLVEHLLIRDTAVRLATTADRALEQVRSTDGGSSGCAITLPLTHQSLASMIGSNRVTVTRKLLELQESGYVRSLGRNAMAVNPSKLKEYAQAASESDR